MRTKSDSDYSIPSGAGGGNEQQAADVIYLHDRANDSTGSAISQTRYRPGYQRRQPINIRSNFGEAHSFDIERSKAEKELINYAYECICNARDTEADQVERSNYFDEWKDLLHTINKKIKNLSVNHRKILGAMIVAARFKDAADFQDQKLKLLENSTYLLRQYRVTKSDSKRIINDLINLNMEITIPLSSENLNSNDEEKLMMLMDELVKKSESQ